MAKHVLTHFGCWVHARRYFLDAAKVLPPGQSGHTRKARDDGSGSV